MVMRVHSMIRRLRARRERRADPTRYLGTATLRVTQEVCMGIPNDTEMENEIEEKRRQEHREEEREAQRRKAERSLDTGLEDSFPGVRPRQRDAAATLESTTRSPNAEFAERSANRLRRGGHHPPRRRLFIIRALRLDIFREFRHRIAVSLQPSSAAAERGQMARRYFGTDGIRGRANGVITPELALRVGQAAGLDRSAAAITAIACSSARIRGCPAT